MKFFAGEENKQQVITLNRGRGCDACLNIKYRGREGLYEMLEITASIRRMIVDKVADDLIKERAIKDGMMTLRMQGISHIIRGMTTLAELSRVVDMREE